MIKIYNNDISKVFVGNGEIAKGFVGEDLIYQNEIDYSKEYFTIEVISAGTLSWAASDVEYSVNGGSWTTWNSNYVASSGDKIRFRSSTNTTYNGISIGMTGGKMNAYGNAMSLFYGDNYESNSTLPADQCLYALFKNNANIINAEHLVLTPNEVRASAYGHMFYNCSGLLTAPELSAMIINKYGYDNMFNGCTSLTEAPELPATTLINEYCYWQMFRGCTSLTKAPSVLPATEFSGSTFNKGKDAYDRMFYGCTSLTTAPEIKATSLGNNTCVEMFRGCTSLVNVPDLEVTAFTNTYSCKGMFYGCSALTKAPALPATTLNTYCYQEMFALCSSLVTAPSLPATNLANYCYYNMFQGCASLTTAPVLSATVMKSNCYNAMFSGCISLTTAPALPSTSLDSYCYYNMFNECSSLVNAPALNATTMKSGCYKQMFRGCTSLTTAPELPATTLVSECYNAMFWGCSSLNYIKCLATDISAGLCTTNWVDGVANSGTFIQNNNMDDWTVGVNGIPTGWQVQGGYNVKYFSIEAEAPTTLSWNVSDVEYSTDDGSTWAAWTGSTTLAQNDIAIFRSTGNTDYNGKTISSTGDIVAYGNAMSLFYGDNFFGQTTFPSNSGNEFKQLFKNNTHLLNVQYLKLNATTLNANSYANMFEGCTSLTSVPKLPATTLGNSCYYGMFQGCTSLNTVPILSATAMTDSCYCAMFMGCTGLTTTPALPATSLAQNCYAYMFNGCTSLTAGPVLNATTLAFGCYSYMFQGCSSLAEAPALPATTLANYCYSRMFEGTAITSAPNLKAATLSDYCYFSMFKNCSSLDIIKCFATDISATNCTTDWVDGVAASGTFYKNDTMTGWTTGVNGVPTGWTLQNPPTLPNVSYLCNYNADDFDESTQTFYRSETGQTFDNDITLVGTGTATKTGNYVSVPTTKYKTFSFANAASNPFNGWNNATGMSYTFIYKVRWNNASNACNIISDRDNSNINWCVRGNIFHTSDGNFLKFVASANPSTMVVRVDADANAERKCIETNQSATGTCSYGPQTSVVNFFTGYANRATEPLNGDFYWLYVSREYLTDAQVQQVIDYNENK